MYPGTPQSICMSKTSIAMGMYKRSMQHKENAMTAWGGGGGSSRVTDARPSAKHLTPAWRTKPDLCRKVQIMHRSVMFCNVQYLS